MDGKGRSSPKMQVTKRIVVPPEAQKCVEVVTKHESKILVYPDSKLFTNQMSLVAAGVANVRRDEPLKALVTNFGSTPIELYVRHPISKAATHTMNLLESHISQREMLGLIPYELMDGKFRKPRIYPENIDTINKHLGDQRERHMSADETPTKAKDIKIDVPQEKETSLRNMTWKHERIWLDQLGEIKETELWIDLKPDVKHFKSPPYRTGTKTRELEKSEINKQ